MRWTRKEVCVVIHRKSKYMCGIRVGEMGAVKPRQRKIS